MLTSASGVGEAGAIASSGAALTTTPSYIATGTVGETAGPDVAATYGTNAAGDMFMLVLMTRTETVAPAALGGWSPQLDFAVSAFARVRVYTRDTRSTGSESGTVEVFSVAANCIIAAIHTFRNVATSSFIEDATTGGENSANTSIEAPQVDAGGTHRLAVAIGGATDDLSVGAFTGETGGDWTLKHTHASTVGSDACIWLQTAALDAGGTITGGAVTVASAEEWSQHGFALVGV